MVKRLFTLGADAKTLIPIGHTIAIRISHAGRSVARILQGPYTLDGSRWICVVIPLGKHAYTAL